MKEQVLAVQRMQDYIERNGAEEISLSDLTRASLFSPWYSYRLFRSYLGLTPAEYIRKCRLTEAAKRLRGGAVKVIDAALDAGFANVDTFTRAFNREFGLNPSDYMKRPVPVTFFIPYGAKYRELRKENIDVTGFHTGRPQAGAPVHHQARHARGGLLPILRGGELRRVGYTYEHAFPLRRACFHVAAAAVQKARNLHLRAGCGGRAGLHRRHTGRL